MKSFRTELSLDRSSFSIQLSTPVFTTGSCFSDAIGNLLDRHKFKTASNPFGATYNPLSIHKGLQYGLHNELPGQHTYVVNQALWSNYDYHSSFSETSKSAVQNRIADAIGSAHYFLKDARFLIITYGTAWVFERIDTGEFVGNCHKVPAANFRKRLLAVEEIIGSFKELHTAMTLFNPALKIIVTVSPVRHTRDTLELNSVSKSILRVAAHQISEDYTNTEYFPSFELMMDDLRDYRFYESDMLHPSEEATLYIWGKFCERYFDQGVKDFIQKWGSIYSSLNHHAFHPESESHKEFLLNTLMKLGELKSVANVDKEIKFIQTKLLQL